MHMYLHNTYNYMRTHTHAHKCIHMHKQLPPRLSQPDRFLPSILHTYSLATQDYNNIFTSSTQKQTNLYSTNHTLCISASCFAPASVPSMLTMPRLT